MPFIYRLRIPALFCALSVLVCELISRPYVNMGISDDVPYILMARTLATTGHVVYNGWAAPILGWQLYMGAAFIKLFGFSFTTVRMSTLLVAMALAFVLQRVLVTANITERNATIGTLALVLSPLYLILSVTYMTDIFGLFAIVTCLYGCLHALQASTPRSTIAWLCFAVATNALFGTARQIAWLGILVLLPCTLLLLRAHRRVLLAGIAATLAGALFIVACLQWLKHQPYSIPEHLLVKSFRPGYTLTQLIQLCLEIPFLLLPLAAVFLPQVWNRNRRSLVLVIAALITYSAFGIHRGFIPLLEPTYGDWVGIHGIHEDTHLMGTPPVFLHQGVRIGFTIASLGGLLGFIASLLRAPKALPVAASSRAISWQQLTMLLAPFSLLYVLLLIPRAAIGLLFDRYALALLVVTALGLLRYYQDRIHPRLPLAASLLVAVMAIDGVAATHNQFSLYRARVALAAELRADGLPDTSVDNGFEYNFAIQLQRTGHINQEEIVNPAGAYIPPPPLPATTCPMFWYDKTPVIHPLYGVSFDPNECYGLAPFAPVHYARWLSSTGTLYVVRYTPPATH